MANTYTSLFYHIVFSTKNRTPFIRPEIEDRIWAYVGGIARNHKMTALQIGGIEDHLHALGWLRLRLRHLKSPGSSRGNRRNGFMRQRHPGIEWRAIAGMRDRLIHGYFGIDYDIVWDVIANKIPALDDAVKLIITQEYP